MKLGDSILSWKAKKQATISRLSAEVEYRNMGITTSKTIWTYGLLLELGVDFVEIAHLYCDNKAAIQISGNPMFHK